MMDHRNEAWWRVGDTPVRLRLSTDAGPEDRFDGHYSMHRRTYRVIYRINETGRVVEIHSVRRNGPMRADTGSRELAETAAVQPCRQPKRRQDDQCKQPPTQLGMETLRFIVRPLVHGVGPRTRGDVPGITGFARGTLASAPHTRG
jgi:hypothetical protein